MADVVAVLVLVVVLVVAAVVYDLVNRGRGRYRPRSYWEDASRRRKAHIRTTREQRRGTERPDRR